MNSIRSLTKTGKRQQNKEIILIIDDEFGIVDSIKIWLERYNFAVCGFTDPLQALESLNTIRAQLLLFYQISECLK